ncbi:MAG TPA: sugar ABC transporter permease [Lentisphaeria bacterium]|nr:MAG: hypothetical protein A2X45_25165 [Lentisphaerae bacterium GWF2_50_93]HCE42105.1 sugar ABC transporter permease [Lentisphaeria bacterium]
MNPKLKRYLTAYAFLLPNGVGFMLFMLLPILVSFGLAFTDCQMLKPNIRFIGFGNFINLLGFYHDSAGWHANDPDFWYYLYNTIFLMIGIPISMAASLGMAILLNQKLKGIVLFRTLFYLPHICSGIAIFMVWRMMYHADVGIINTILGWLDIQGPDWLNSITWAKPALIIMGVWGAAGGNNMIIYLAALKGVPESLFEAADIDGASAWQKFRYVTWPQLAPATFFIFTMSIIGGFQGGFNMAYIMTQGGPSGSTTTIGYYIFNMAYDGELLLGYGSAIAWVLFVLVMGATILNWKCGKSGENDYA